MLEVKTMTTNILKSFNDIHSASIKYFNVNSGIMGCHDISINNFIYITALHDMENPTVTELSLRLNISKASVTQMIDSLESKGYVKRIFPESDQADKRSRTIKLTEKSLSMIKDGEILHQKFFEEIFGIITKEEYLQLEYLIDKIAKNMKKKLQEEKIK